MNGLFSYKHDKKYNHQFQNQIQFELDHQQEDMQYISFEIYYRMVLSMGRDFEMLLECMVQCRVFSEQQEDLWRHISLTPCRIGLHFNRMNIYE